MPFVVATFYHFFDFPQYAETRTQLKSLFDREGIKGSLLIAAEGINGTLSGTRESIDRVLRFLKKEIVRGEFEHKESHFERQPFGKAKVRLKKETISIGETVSMKHFGEYVEAKDWNALISDPETFVLDARNSYETHLGTFENAVDPETRNFRELPAFVKKNMKDKNQKIATFCTGGIRCEKLTSWLKDQGYENVYHLKGGILKYLEQIPESESKWQGECYVFDERVAVGHGLAPSSTATSCNACGHTLKEDERKHPSYVKDVSCPYCCD